MEKNQDLARVYDLIEKFNFSELSDEEKEFVLTRISEEEYMDMRSTLGDTLRYFSKYPEEDHEARPSTPGNFFTLRLELYKIAVLFLVALGIGFLLSRAVMDEHPDTLAIADTVYITQQDTLHLITRDTVEIIKEKVSIKEVFADKQIASDRNEHDNPSDCSQEICPDDLASLNHLSRKNNFSHDKELTEFTVALH